MSPPNDIQLAKKYAPIFWLHEKEAFLPEDCGIAVEISDLYRDNRRERDEEQPRNLTDLGDIPNSGKCYLKVRDLDLRKFVIPESYHQAIPELGPGAVAKLARHRYGTDYMKEGIPENKRNIPKYYARVSRMTLYDDGSPFARYYENDPGIFGEYKMIEYFFYFVFNDAWNMHQGDWDATIELFIRRDRKYMVTHMHHSKWLSKWPQNSSPDIRTWLRGWNKLKKRDVGEAYVLGNHPYVFVAQGAHGAYPTPGFTLHGLGLPGDDFLACTDERQIGRLCILPEGFNEEIILTNLRVANLEANRVQFGFWKEPELVKAQPWRRYEGKWGEDTKFHGWDGPQRPAISRPPNKKSLMEADQSGYKGGRVVQNWHGVR